MRKKNLRKNTLQVGSSHLISSHKLSQADQQPLITMSLHLLYDVSRSLLNKFASVRIVCQNVVALFMHILNTLLGMYFGQLQKPASI